MEHNIWRTRSANLDQPVFFRQIHIIFVRNCKKPCQLIFIIREYSYSSKLCLNIGQRESHYFFLTILHIQAPNHEQTVSSWIACIRSCLSHAIYVNMLVEWQRKNKYGVFGKVIRRLNRNMRWIAVKKTKKFEWR